MLCVGWTEGTITNCLPCASACVFSRWTFGQTLGHRRCTETVSLPCDCRKKIVGSHDVNFIGFFSIKATNSPSDVLLKVEVFREDFVTVITLQLWTFSFQLLCWVKFSEWILILRSSSYSSYPRSLRAVSLMNSKLAMMFDDPPQIPVAPSGLFLLLLGRLGMMTFSKSPSSVRLLVMLQIFVLVPCFPGL